MIIREEERIRARSHHIGGPAVYSAALQKASHKIFVSYIAAETGCAFFDTFTAMGGAGFTWGAALCRVGNAK